MKIILHDLDRGYDALIGSRCDRGDRGGRAVRALSGLLRLLD